MGDASRPTAPGTDDVRRIAAIENPVIRNLQITECYARLSAAFAARSGEGANWCSYATWASRQAGRTIRGEDLLEHLNGELGRSRWLLHPFATFGRNLLRRGLFQPETRLGRLAGELHTPFDAFERASAAVARGNLKVFEEIGLEFARYLELRPEDSASFDTFLDRLKPGDPPDGQGYLRLAFERYERLRDERDPRTHAESALLANLEIGLHEQTRLQPEIGEALDAAVATQEDLGRRALEALVPPAAHWREALRRPAAAAVGVFASRVQRSASTLAREVITESFMVLSLPGRVLALGTHLADAYPAVLRDPGNADLVALLARYEPVPPAPDNCGARDWWDVDQRMHYIVHLFRVFHLSRELGRPPFTPEQTASFSRGVVPDGEL